MGDYIHINLQQQAFKVLDRPPGTARARHKSTTPTPPPAASRAAKQDPGGSGGRSSGAAARTSEPAGSEGGSDGPARSGTSPKSDSRIRRSMRAAVMAVTAATKAVEAQRQEAAPAAPGIGAAAAAGAPSDGAPGSVAPRQPALNMSNVGRKDREAARALLGFTQLALGVSEGHRAAADMVHLTGMHACSAKGQCMSCVHSSRTAAGVAGPRGVAVAEWRRSHLLVLHHISFWLPPCCAADNAGRRQWGTSRRGPQQRGA